MDSTEGATVPRSIEKRRALLGTAIGIGATLALGLGIFAGVGVAASAAVPVNTSPPKIAGSPQEGQQLTGDRGNWSGSPIGYTYFWTRCDTVGGGCSNISGADTTTYTLALADVGSTIRFKVEARNADGAALDSSVPTAVIVAATKPAPTPATGCPAGTGVVQIADVGSPARLLIDAQQSSPSVVPGRGQQLSVRYHVSACGGRPVQGALVYVTAVPFNQLNIPAEQLTGQDGWGKLDFRMLAGFPVSSKQQLIALFVRARKSGESPLGGISTRRLFSIPVSMTG
jgi:hypothetical protein